MYIDPFILGLIAGFPVGVITTFLLAYLVSRRKK